MNARARRKTEATLLLIAVLVALGGYWLTTITRTQKFPGALIGYTILFIVIYLAAHLAVRTLAPSADPLFLPLAALLNAIGFVVIYRLESQPSSPPAAAQARWLAVAVAAFVLTLYLLRDPGSLARYRYSGAVAGLVLLLLPLVPGLGREVNGARLWIAFGPLNFQPAELAKILLVVFFAAYLTERRELLAVSLRRLGPFGLPAARHFGPLLAAWGASLIVMINLRDLGSSLLFLGIFVAMLWTATGRPAFLAAGGILFAAGAFAAYHLFDHVAVRISVWQDPFAQIHDRGYQIVQSLFALATGGAWGTGLGLGRPDLIPSVQTDFVFSAIGEELGLAGATAVLVAYAMFCTRGFSLATRCRDDFTKLMVAGLTTAFALQTILILGGVTKLIPLTGVTLPFVSYGGSSLLSNFIITALLVRASDSSFADEKGPPTALMAPAGGAR